MNAEFIRVEFLDIELEQELLSIEKNIAQDYWPEKIREAKILGRKMTELDGLLNGLEIRGVIFSFALKDRPCSFSPFFIQELCRACGSLLGQLLVQNEQGATAVSVYDRSRDLSMHSGARYHQTREGGSLHTDNVNIPDPWDYLLFTCLAPAEVGGETILVDGKRLHRNLKKNYPKALAVLEAPFTWEMRGVADKMYEAPIITYNSQGEPLFRYLRPYMVAAHQKAQKPLTLEQLYALDVLDALLELGEMQFRFNLKKGDMLITQDAQVFHGRTCFSDALDAIDLETYRTRPGGLLKRTMERLWIKK